MGRRRGKESMKRISPRNVALAMSTFACAALLSSDWSEHRSASAPHRTEFDASRRSLPGSGYAVVGKGGPNARSCRDH